MITNRILALIVLCILGVFSCEKIEIPEPDITGTPTPVFSLSLTLDGMNSIISGGEECTELIADYSIDQFNVYSFNALFQNDQDCVASPIDQSALKFEIRDHKIRNTTQNIEDDGIQIGTYDYFTNREILDSYEVSINTFGYNNIYTIKTSDGQEIPLDAPNKVLVFPSNLEWISLESLSITTGLVASTQKIILRPENTTFSESLIDVLSLNYGSPLTLGFCGELDENFTYLWSNGSTECMTVPDFSYLSDLICVEIFDDAGLLLYEECISLFELDLSPPGSSLINTSISSKPDFAPSNELKSVIIEYTDSDGTIFTSIDMNENSRFEVLDIEDFGLNDAGLSTSKLDIEFECILQAESSEEQIILTNSLGTIGVAYPN